MSISSKCQSSIKRTSSTNCVLWFNYAQTETKKTKKKNWDISDILSGVNVKMTHQMTE